jgi:glycosyltransferase involved in cell wall biosynthesis
VLKNRKLIYILNSYSKNSPSHFNHVINLLEELSKLNIEIYLIIEKVADLPNLNENIQIYGQKHRNVLMRFFELLFVLFLLRLKGYNKVFVRISRFGALTAIVGRFLFNMTVYYWLSGQGFIENYGRFVGFDKCKDYVTNIFLFRVIAKGVSRFVTGPETMVDYFVNVAGVKRSKIILLYNDIDPNRFFVVEGFEKIKFRKEIGLRLNTKVILFAHRLSPVRRTLEFFPSIISSLEKRSDDFTLLVLGSGPDLVLLKEMCANSLIAKKIEFLGDIPNSEISKYFQLSDIFINPTCAEGFPRVLLESMACGLPIVTTDAGGIKDILGVEQLKYMSSAYSFDDFSNNLGKLLDSPLDQLKLKNENLSTVQCFYTENVANMYGLKIFN